MNITDKDFLERRDAKLEALVREAVEAYAYGFSENNLDPDEVDVRDLADWFADWRLRAKHALGDPK